MHPRRQRRSIPIAPLLAVIGLLSVGCGQATSTVAPTVLSPTPTPVVPTPSPAPTVVPVETDEPIPSDTDTGSPGTPPCAVAALKASRGITEVDGDDRTTEVILKAADTCSVDAFPALLLEDGTGKVLVVASAGGPGGIDLVGGVAYTTTVRLGNWCLGEPSYPVRIAIQQGSNSLLVTGDSFPDEGDLPPCAHDDADPSLSGTAWQPSP